MLCHEYVPFELESRQNLTHEPWSQPVWGGNQDTDELASCDHDHGRLRAKAADAFLVGAESMHKRIATITRSPGMNRKLLDGMGQDSGWERDRTCR